MLLNTKATNTIIMMWILSLSLAGCIGSFSIEEDIVQDGLIDDGTNMPDVMDMVSIDTDDMSDSDDGTMMDTDMVRDPCSFDPCANGETCCSADGLTAICTDSNIDQQCGTCGNTCASDDFCVDGICVFDDPCDPNPCSNGEICCGGTCIADTETNMSHCGACFNTCTVNMQVCEMGTCIDLNACGGTTQLSDEPGTSCGPCVANLWTCDGMDAVLCTTDAICKNGETCTDNAECLSDICTLEYCVPLDGYVYIPEGTDVTLGSPGIECPNGNCIDPRCDQGTCPSQEQGRFMDGSEDQYLVANIPAFFMKKTEVTQGEYFALTGERPTFFQNCGDDCPVNQVSFHEALGFANIMSLSRGYTQCYDLTNMPTSITVVPNCDGFQLPDRDQWEYAARAGVTGTGWTDETELGMIARYRLNSGTDGLYSSLFLCFDSDWDPNSDYCGPTTVCSKTQNAWGLCDMLGNMNEFIMHDDSLTDTAYYMRGCGWDGQFPSQCRFAWHWNINSPTPSEGYRTIGFRVILPLNP